MGYCDGRECSKHSSAGRVSSRSGRVEWPELSHIVGRATTAAGAGNRRPYKIWVEPRPQRAPGTVAPTKYGWNRDRSGRREPSPLQNMGGTTTTAGAGNRRPYKVWVEPRPQRGREPSLLQNMGG